MHIFPTTFSAILHTSLTSIIIYSRYKSTVVKLIILQNHKSIAVKNFNENFVLCHVPVFCTVSCLRNEVHFKLHIEESLYCIDMNQN
jgi:hypothetical protein